MPLIQELPNTGPTRISHGWAYVPDPGPIPAMAQPQSRKRHRHDAGTTNATATAKQQKAVQQRLEALDKENYKDGVSVPIPARPGRQGKPGKKMTSNVRRILTYQRTFQHYLADEEAGVNVYPSQPNVQRSEAKRKTAQAKEPDPKPESEPPSPVVVEEQKPSKRSARAAEREKDKSRREAAKAAHPPRAPSGTDSAANAVQSVEGDQEDTVTTDAHPSEPENHSTGPVSSTTVAAPTAATSTMTTTTTTDPPRPPRPLYDPSYDKNPLLRTLNLPKMPSDKVMQQLLAEPPLSYLQTRAKPVMDMSDMLDEDGNGHGGARLSATQHRNKNPSLSVPIPPPRRYFCAICGYWARVKCRKCGEWTCGIMECWKGHEGVCVALGMY